AHAFERFDGDGAARRPRAERARSKSRDARARRIHAGAHLAPSGSQVARGALGRARARVASYRRCNGLVHNARASCHGCSPRGGAPEDLTQGYKLKEPGNLREALPHLVESLRLDPKLKTTINLADCEEKLGMLVEAQSHWLMGRDRAAREGDERVKQEAEQRL